MAVNPTLAQDTASGDLFPLPASGESMLLKRNDIDFECTLPVGGKLWGKGFLYLSTKRIIFVAAQKTCRGDFTSFEIPLITLSRPQFNQPIFGANYLSGKARPEPGAPAGGVMAGGSAPFSLTFNAGGCGTFLPLFFRQMAELKEQSASAQAVSLAQAAQDGRLDQVAYVDPSDPSVLYLSQPTPAPNTQQVTPFEIEHPPSAPPAEAGRGGGQQGCVCS
mmetsp:Transcript_46542/g.122912  ORF Transcript_46542/g.122912 Transcript_46542/m.122912 type:complete len:220 (-) Transcript_46542:17-676(-)